MRKVSIRKIAISASLLMGLTACGGGAPGEGGETSGGSGGEDWGIVPMLTPRQGGTGYIVGGGLANLISKHVEGAQASVVATTGTQEMAQRLGERHSSGSPAFAYTESSGLKSAFEGTGPYEQEYEGLRALTFAGAADLYMVTTQDSGIDSYEDLAGKTLGIGGPGSPTNLLTLEIMAAHGVEEGEFEGVFLGYEDVIDGLSNGSIDGGVLAGSFPVAAYSELAAQHDVKILPLDEAVRETLLEERPYFVESTVEAGAYNGVEKDIPVLGFATVIATHAKTPDKLVTEVMKVIFERNDELSMVHGSAKQITFDSALDGIGIPLHPAAKQYLEDNGVDVEQ